MRTIRHMCISHTHFRVETLCEAGIRLRCLCNKTVKGDGRSAGESFGIYDPISTVMYVDDKHKCATCCKYLGRLLEAWPIRALRVCTRGWISQRVNERDSFTLTLVSGCLTCCFPLSKRRLPSFPSRRIRPLPCSWHSLREEWGDCWRRRQGCSQTWCHRVRLDLVRERLELGHHQVVG